MWEFVKSAPWTFAIGGLILVGAIVGVIIGVVTKGRWKDAGFMRTDDGKHPLKWALDQFALSVWIAPELEKEWVDAFKRLRGHVQEVIGREVFDQGTPIPDGFDTGHMLQGHVALIPGQRTGGGDFHASTILKWDTRTGALISAVVKLPWPIAKSYVWPVMLHEVGGHVLGLDHDEHVSSVMHPRIQNRPQGLTEKDRKLLRSTYKEA